MHHQQGQTLVETVVAIFILVMGITAALGLAIYSLNASTSINKQIVAIGLAREGIEAVKNMRDTNWLHGTLSNDCHNFNSTQPSNTYCYRDWLNAQYSLEPGLGDGNFALKMDLTNNSIWQLIHSSNFGLNYSEGDLDRGFYVTDGTTTTAQATSDFSRVVNLRLDTFQPFDHTGDLGPRLKVTSQVWWKGTKCPVTETPPTAGTCSVKLETYLTNWRNY